MSAAALAQEQPLLEAEAEQLLSFEEFVEMEFDEPVELIEGRVVPMGWNSLPHTGVTAWLICLLTIWADSSNWGLIFGSDTGVRTKRDPDTTRGADIACASFERYATSAPNGKVFEKGPELLIEVISPSNTWSELQDKIIEYFAIGTSEVWVVSPKHRSVTVYQSAESGKTYTADEKHIVISQQLPGFELSLEKMAAKVDQIEG